MPPKKSTKKSTSRSGSKAKVDSREQTPSTPSSSSQTPTNTTFTNSIMNLNVTPRPFKSSNYSTPKKWKTLKQVLAQEKSAGMTVDVPTYTNIETPPSLLPQKKYCDITGLEAKYTDPKTGLRYHSSEVYRFIKQLSVGAVQEYLGARGAAVVLK